MVIIQSVILTQSVLLVGLVCRDDPQFVCLVGQSVGAPDYGLTGLLLTLRKR